MWNECKLMQGTWISEKLFKIDSQIFNMFILFCFKLFSSRFHTLCNQNCAHFKSAVISEIQTEGIKIHFILFKELFSTLLKRSNADSQILNYIQCVYQI